MKNLARMIFRFLAGQILRRYQPTVIAIAGSVGKTATKEAISAALSTSGRTVRKTSGNFNAEIGVPVTIIVGGQARQHWWQWLSVIGAGLNWLTTNKAYPQTLVLELAADKPGDLQPLLDLTHPQIGVLTSTAPEHLEFFGDADGVVAEESLIVRTLPAHACAVVNIDDERNAAMIAKLPARVVTYGWHQAATVRAESATMTRNAHGLPDGMVVKVAVDGSVIPVAMPGVIGRHQALPLLAALAVAKALGEDVMSAIKSFSGYQPPPGRMRLLAGVEGSLLIDDSYNASPEAMAAALTTLFDLEVPGKKYAILGQMSELGTAAVDWHERIGRMIIPKTMTELITVGPLAEKIGLAAITAGFPNTRVHNVPDAASATAILRPKLTNGDVVLLKGSRYAARLERAAHILLANPQTDSTKLVGGGG